jgi:hypothetical protein
MILPSAQKHYASASRRLFGAAFDRFLIENIPMLGGAELRKLLIDKILELLDAYSVASDRLKPGQMLWVGIDKYTRPDSPKVRYLPVILTLVAADDIDNLAEGRCTPPKQLPDLIARTLKEAYAQNALLSMRDLGLILKRHPTDLSEIRQMYEQRSGEVLPTPATLQDIGSGVSHKTLILKKVLIEKKDMAQVRRETAHSQEAIDSYLKAYRRVEMLLDENKSVMFIAKVTNMSPYLVLQYEKIYQYIKQRLRLS